MLKCKVVENDFFNGVNIYLFQDDPDNGTQAFLSFDENNNLCFTPVDQTLAPSVPPIFLSLRSSSNKLSKQYPSKILQALAEGLKDFGIVAEVDNKQRIVSEALAAERLRLLDIEQKRIDKILFDKK